MFIEVIKRVLAIPKLQTMIEAEKADGVLTTNQGQELAEANRLLSVSYVVKVRKVRVADYGSISHRHRVVLVCILRDFPGANDFEMPAPTWGVNGKVACARDVSASDELFIATMDSKYFYSGKLTTRYDVQDSLPTPEPKLQHSRLLKLGRVAPGMGHSTRPHLSSPLTIRHPKRPHGLWLRRRLATNGLCQGW